MKTFAAAFALVVAFSGEALAAPDRPPAGVVEIVRTNLVTGDLSAMKQFYQQVFDFKVADETVVGKGVLQQLIASQWSLPAGQALYTVILKAPEGETALGLTGVQGGAIEVLRRHRLGPPQSGDHYLILRVADIDEVKRRLDARGVEFWRPVMKVTGAREMGAFDPDGTRLIIEQEEPKPAL